MYLFHASPRGPARRDRKRDALRRCDVGPASGFSIGHVPLYVGFCFNLVVSLLFLARFWAPSSAPRPIFPDSQRVITRKSIVPFRRASRLFSVCASLFDTRFIRGFFVGRGSACGISDDRRWDGKSTPVIGVREVRDAVQVASPALNISIYTTDVYCMDTRCSYERLVAETPLAKPDLGRYSSGFPQRPPTRDFPAPIAPKTTPNWKVSLFIERAWASCAFSSATCVARSCQGVATGTASWFIGEWAVRATDKRAANAPGRVTTAIWALQPHFFTPPREFHSEKLLTLRHQLPGNRRMRVIGLHPIFMKWHLKSPWSPRIQLMDGTKASENMNSRRRKQLEVLY